jgi:LysM domain
MRYRKIILCLFILFTFSREIFAQDDDGEEIKMSQEEWHLKRDQYAVSAITLLSRLETLNNQIDSLKKINEESENISSGCEDELYKLVGASKEQVSDYRKKFEEAEKNISSKTGTPGEIRNSFYREISESKIRCLPEFRDRYTLLKKNVDDMTEINSQNKKDISAGMYEVVKGDNLRKIAESIYGDKDYWPVIWEANKEGVVNKDSFDDFRKQRIHNPNIIYPGQILLIPQKPESTERETKRFRKHKK